MKKLIVISLWMGVIQSAFGMPCDSGYDCVSKTKKYKVSLQRCRYRNSIHLLSTTINGTEVSGAVLNKGWDGENVLGFEINLPTTPEGAVKILTAEIGNHKIGLMKIKYADSEPGPLSTQHSEAMTCVISE